jgi:hypothetical protein
MLRYATSDLWRVIMACNTECTPCFCFERHIARHKQGLYPGGRDGVRYARLCAWTNMVIALHAVRRPKATWRAMRYRIKSKHCGRHTNFWAPGRDDSAAPLAASTEEIHYSVHPLADVNRAYVAAGLGRWDQRSDLDPLPATEIYECKNQMVTSD